MTDSEFDAALVGAGFRLAAERGWPEVSVTAAARAAGLALDRARGRFLGRRDILMRFGRLADQSALAHAEPSGGHRDRLFDLVMRRIDFLQSHREGVLALKTFLPREPGLALALYGATLVSMAWLLEAAGVPARGWRGSLRVQGLGVIWLATLRAWERDDGEDLSTTMAALDRLLDRAVRAEGWVRFSDEAAADTPTGTTEMVAEPPAADPPASPPI